MTIKERNQIKQAIRLIHTTGDYDAGMRLLCELVGMTIRSLPVRSTSISELAARPNSKFRVKQRITTGANRGEEGE